MRRGGPAALSFLGSRPARPAGVLCAMERMGWSQAKVHAVLCAVPCAVGDVLARAVWLVIRFAIHRSLPRPTWLSIRPAMRPAAAVLPALMLGACSTLPIPALKEPGPPPPILLQVEAPPALRTLLERHLDLARLAQMRNDETLDETEWARLVAAAPARRRPKAISRRRCAWNAHRARRRACASSCNRARS